MKTLLLLLVLPFCSYSLSIERLLIESNLVVEGKVLDRYEIENNKGFNRVALVEILKIYKGIYQKKKLKIYYDDKWFHTRIYFGPKEHFICFLNLQDSIAETISNHNGKFDFGREITEDFAEFLNSYVRSFPPKEKLKFLLQYLNMGNEFSLLAHDLYSFKENLNLDEQQKLFEIASRKTREILKSIPNRGNANSNNSSDLIHNYDELFVLIQDEKLQSKARFFLKSRLNLTNSQSISRQTIFTLIRIAKRHRIKKKRLLKKYMKSNKYIYDPEDKIDDDLAELINYFKTH